MWALWAIEGVPEGEVKRPQAAVRTRDAETDCSKLNTVARCVFSCCLFSFTSQIFEGFALHPDRINTTQEYKCSSNLIETELCNKSHCITSLLHANSQIP